MTARDGGADLAAALQNARSASWSVRAAAGRTLATAVDVEDAAGTLRDLLLDTHDSAVTQETAGALLRRRDVPGLHLVLAALAAASRPVSPEGDPSTMDEIYSAVMGDSRWMTADGCSELCEQLQVLSMDTDESVSGQARKILGRTRPSAG